MWKPFTTFGNAPLSAKSPKAQSAGYIKGIHYLKTHPNEALAILQEYPRTDDPADLRETYEAGLNLTLDKPYPTLKGIQNFLREFSVKYPKAQTACPEQFVNSTFLKELDSSGFIDCISNAARDAGAQELAEQNNNRREGDDQPVLTVPTRERLFSHLKASWLIS